MDEDPRSRDVRRTFLIILGLAVGLGLVMWWVLRSDPSSGFSPHQHENEVVDLLGWLPANDDALRRYSAWSAEPGDPLSFSAAIDQLGIDPPPLALGRSTQWESVTGFAATQVTGWASAPGAGMTVLAGAFDQAAIISALEESGYLRASHQGVTIWVAPQESDQSSIVAGDDLRALAAIAMYGDRIVIGYDQASVEASLEAAGGQVASLADQAAVQRAVNEWTAGIMVGDQRDIAIACGAGRGWQVSDFASPSGRRVMLVWSRGSIPTTSVRVEYQDDLTAFAGLTALEGQWQTGYLIQTGLMVQVSNLATAQSVYVDGTFVVADLVQGRDNGWTRSGVQYLVGICEHASRQIPAESPVQGSPVASPSPTE